MGMPNNRDATIGDRPHDVIEGARAGVICDENRDTGSAQGLEQGKQF
jgi:hypothetical protein